MRNSENITTGLSGNRTGHVTSLPVVRQMKVTVSIAFLLALSSCEVEPVATYIQVDTSLQDYYERFIDEAAVRGLDLEDATYQVNARIGEISEPNVIGQCSWNQSHVHNILVDEDYWRTASDLQREFLMFHELGHCVLGLDHEDIADARGNCASIMSSGTGSCRVIYTNTNRKVLLDELFSN